MGLAHARPNHKALTYVVMQLCVGIVTEPSESSKGLRES